MRGISAALSPGGSGNGSGVVSRASASPSNGAGNGSGGVSRYTSASPSNGGCGAGSDGTAVEDVPAIHNKKNFGVF